MVATIGPIDVKTKTMRSGESKDKKLVIWVDPKLNMHEPVDDRYQNLESKEQAIKKYVEGESK